jgi:hypothetical protein
MPASPKCSVSGWRPDFRIKLVRWLTVIEPTM